MILREGNTHVRGRPKLTLEAVVLKDVPFLISRNMMPSTELNGRRIYVIDPNYVTDPNLLEHEA